jgi:hypothetical protein
MSLHERVTAIGATTPPDSVCVMASIVASLGNKAITGQTAAKRNLDMHLTAHINPDQPLMQVSTCAHTR